MVFPDFDPVALQIGPLAIRWYALSYIAGILLAWRYCIWYAKQPPVHVSRNQLDDLMFWATMGIILGGRLGQVLLWQPGYYLAHPLEILKIWEGGMAFHGGFLGVVLAIYLYARNQKLSLWWVADVIAPSTPIGLFLGRVANFINGELWGRPGDVPWAMVFPNAGPLPRHPSQLYEAALEGLLLFVVLAIAVRMGALKRPGLVVGLFAIVYAMARSFCEFFREPDPQLGFLWGGLTMGMLLSVPLIAAGIGFVLWALTRPVRDSARGPHRA